MYSDYKFAKQMNRMDSGEMSDPNRIRQFTQTHTLLYVSEMMYSDQTDESDGFG